MPATATNIDKIFHALGDPTRRAMVEKISAGPVSASDLAKPLGISLAAVVQQLHVLENSGLIVTEKIGRVRTCRTNPAGFSNAGKWLEDQRSTWERRLDRLGKILEEP